MWSRDLVSTNPSSPGHAGRQAVAAAHRPPAGQPPPPLPPLQLRGVGLLQVEGDVGPSLPHLARQLVRVLLRQTCNRCLTTTQTDATTMASLFENGIYKGSLLTRCRVKLSLCQTLLSGLSLGFWWSSSISHNSTRVCRLPLSS